MQRNYMYMYIMHAYMYMYIMRAYIYMYIILCKYKQMLYI